MHLTLRVSEACRLVLVITKVFGRNVSNADPGPSRYDSSPDNTGRKLEMICHMVME